jgi:hypothetical protein
MAELNDILQRFKDETLLNTYTVRIISGEISMNRNNIEKRIPSIKDNLQDYFDNPNDEILSYKSDFETVLNKTKSLGKKDKEKLLYIYKTPINIHLENITGKEALLNLNSKPIRVALENESFAESISFTNEPTFFQYLFWLSHKNEQVFEFRYLKCGNGQKFSDSLDIGFGDNIIMQYKGKKINDLSKILNDSFTFNSQDSTFLFIQKYSSSSDKSFTIYGKNKRANIDVVDNKWLIQKIINKPFPKKLTDFTELNVVKYPFVNFVESSKAKEAYEAIQAEETKGNTLISLWQIYSEIELNKALQLKDKIGELKYKIARHLPEGITRIQIANLTEELKATIHNNKDELIRSAVEIHRMPNEDSEATSNTERFSIKTISTDLGIELYDELNILPKDGVLSISVHGNEIVNKRRKWALKSLKEDRKLITRNLLFAIEGVADAMLDKKRNNKPLTNRTREFLKAKFGIDDLTPNQKDAVDIAINTPDIAIIQGPPGTGKSTVVAAVCDRLIEIAEKEKEGHNDKLILVSAFQNDTVEDIASKIYTMGLPTIKIGKETQGNIRVEDKLIVDIKNNIDNAIQHLSVNSSSYRISNQLKDFRKIYLNESNENDLRRSIEKLGIFDKISDDLLNDWKEITDNQEYNTESIEKNKKALKGLRTDIESYNDDGYYKVRKLQKIDIPFTAVEKQMLSNAVIDNPHTEFLEELLVLKEKYLEIINSSFNDISFGSNLSLLDWLDNTIHYLSIKEEISFQDEETFIVANLESIREELEGNANFIRESIKTYGESLAATNQVAGGREMSFYKNVENVVLEEAARSNPLDLLIPMSKATERIIMVGDQNQLPHLLEDDIADETVNRLSDEIKISDKRKKLEEALFGVIFNNLSSVKPRRTITLTEQFRMHPFIGDFISKVYYGGKLKKGIVNQEELKKHKLQLNWAKEKVAVFCNVGKNKGKEIRGKSKCRPSEANQIIKLLDELKTDSHFEDINIGIITFYAKQVEEIFKAAVKKNYAVSNPDGTYEISNQYKETPDGREKLRIGSVDSFQGKEFDVVILSTVRSNEIQRNHDSYKKVFGFLTLENRLNVAFSRAQKLLIVVGDSAMFSDDYAKTYVEGLHEFYTNLSIDKTYGNRL